MATKYCNLKGRIRWAKLYEPDSFSGAENWVVNFYPYDGAEWEKFQKTGLQLKVRTDDENAKFIKLRRPTKKVIKDEIVIFSPPEITGKVQVSYVNENGDRIRQYNKGEKVSVKRDGDPVDLGNGTLVVVNFSYYDTAKGPGHRMESLTVLDLVEYNKEVNVPETKVEENKEETQAPKKVDLDDDIPF